MTAVITHPGGTGINRIESQILIKTMGGWRMPVAIESIIHCLEEMMQLEELATQSLIEFRKKDFSFINPGQRHVIRFLLERLKGDSRQHEKNIREIIQILKERAKIG